MRSRYHRDIDVDAPNNAHAMALELVGFNRRVLELGAASGHVTRVLAQRHCDVTAIECDADVAHELAGVAGRVVVGDLDDPGVLQSLPGEFDVVLAGDVLEHLRDPGAVLRRAARLLAPGGRVVVSLPNIGHADVRLSLLHGRWRYGPWGLMDRTHIHFFTREAIDEMVRQAGLVMTDLRRVLVPAFETELEVDREAISAEVVNQVLADPEAETYQFVFAAVREDADDQMRRVSSDKHALAGALEQSEIRRAAAETEVRHLHRELAELRAASDAEIRDLRKQRVEIIEAGEAERERLSLEGSAREQVLVERTDALERLRGQRAGEHETHRAHVEALQAALAAEQATRAALRRRVIRALGGPDAWAVRMLRAARRGSRRLRA